MFHHLNLHKTIRTLLTFLVSGCLILSIFGDNLLLIRRELRRSEAHDNLTRYQAINRLIPPYVEGRVIFFGDSITDFWATDEASKFFPDKPYVGRGISGESTDGMVTRFQQDVIDLHPSAVVILAGTNDVILPERHIGFTQTTQNITTMVTMAHRAHIPVVLCSILPVSHFSPSQQFAYSKRINTINEWIRRYAVQEGLSYVDYHSAMADNTDSLKDSLSEDGVHPNDAGYGVMEPLAERGIERAIKEANAPSSIRTK
jgi:lysophospholipase L1-like esterase